MDSWKLTWSIKLEWWQGYRMWKERSSSCRANSLEGFPFLWSGFSSVTCVAGVFFCMWAPILWVLVLITVSWRVLAPKIVHSGKKPPTFLKKKKKAVEHVRTCPHSYSWSLQESWLKQCLPSLYLPLPLVLPLLEAPDRSVNSVVTEMQIQTE